ncbi:hypothetical protein SMU57_05633 [Streptococcus mutans NMT4863]|nr:hypothetical protein SMU57_05633 [Streptococcus mutans NMT4863]
MGSLFCDVQNNENFRFEALEIMKVENLTFDILDELIAFL